MPDTGIHINPIGYVHSDQKYRYETSRQGVLSSSPLSIIELLPNQNFEQAIIELEGFDRIWVLFQFHLNDNWKPMVQPPRHTRKKIGVFASRAPYRPNSIGMSCVKLLKIEGLKIYISESDILDGSPVFDIKPYLPYSDSFPDAKTGWVKNGPESMYEVRFEERAAKQMQWLKEQANINLPGFAKLQLEFNPADDSRKRIKRVDANDEEQQYILAYRTWRIHYMVNETNRVVLITAVSSGYTNEELAHIQEDKYNDKALHQIFVETEF